MADIQQSPDIQGRPDLSQILSQLRVNSLDELNPEQQQILSSMSKDEVTATAANPAKMRSLISNLANATPKTVSTSTPIQTQQLQSSGNAPTKKTKLSDLISTAAEKIKEAGTQMFNPPTQFPEQPTKLSREASENAMGATGQPGVPSQMQVQDRRSTTQTIMDIQKVYANKSDPHELKNAFKAIDSATTSDMAKYLNTKDEKTGKSINDYISDMRAKIADLTEQRKDIIPQQSWGQLAEQVAHSLTQLVAGFYGMKYGVNLSGIKFDQTNWEERIRTRLQAVNDQINDLKGSERDITQEKMGVIGQIMKRGEDEKRAIVDEAKEREKDRRSEEREAVGAARQDAHAWDMMEHTNTQIQAAAARQQQEFENRLKLLPAQEQEKERMKQAQQEQKDNQTLLELQGITAMAAKGNISGSVAKKQIADIVAKKGVPADASLLADKIAEGQGFFTTDYKKASEFLTKVINDRNAAKNKTEQTIRIFNPTTGQSGTLDTRYPMPEGFQKQ